jgi:DNA polymerase IV
MIRFAKAWPRIIAHADMDAFYAAIEQLDDPALRGRPILVGSLSNRGVVLTASYEARPFGVGSAMPMARARRLCPRALIIRPRFDRYQQVSRTIMRVFSDFSPDVEPLSLDEAFLDMTGSERLFGDPQSMGRRLKDAVREATGGLTVSVGLSATKYVAKVASACQKPDGLTVVPPDEAKAWLAPLPVSWLWGAGPKTEARLHQMGLQTIGDMAEIDPKVLFTKLGKVGLHFHALAHAEDPRLVIGRRSAKSIGSEQTLDRDISGKADLKPHLRRSADVIGRRLRQKRYVAFGVGVKLKTADFQILTRQRRLSEPTDITESLYTAGVDLLDEFNHPGPFRLVGMAVYDLIGSDDRVQLDLFSSSARQRRLDGAIDELVERFGPDVVHRADDLTQTPGMRFS